jgi:hypothetical protein
MIVMRGAENATFAAGSGHVVAHLTWEDRALVWSAGGTGSQMNAINEIYRYIAIG